MTKEVNEKKQGVLYLLPMMLGGDEANLVIPQLVQQQIVQMTCLIVENVRTARRYLKLLDKTVDIDAITFYELNKHTKEAELDAFLAPLKAGKDVGLLSEAGLPCLADPGNVIVERAHRQEIRVVPFTGPSSIILALVASGLNGQNFAFNGYLPITPKERIQALQRLENRAQQEKQSQIFMETPYRNMQLLEEVLRVCDDRTRLTIAVDITLPQEFIVTKTVKQWKNNLPDLHKRPTVFVIL